MAVALLMSGCSAAKSSEDEDIEEKIAQIETMDDDEIEEYLIT